MSNVKSPYGYVGSSGTVSYVPGPGVVDCLEFISFDLLKFDRERKLFEL